MRKQSIAALSKHGIMGFVILDVCQCASYPSGMNEVSIEKHCLCKTNIPVNSDRLHPSWLTGCIIPNIDVILGRLAVNSAECFSLNCF